MTHHAATAPAVPTVPGLAEQAATAVHQFAVLARPGITALDLQALHATTGALVELAAAFPQILRQLQGYLNDDRHDGHLAIEIDADPVSGCLRHAGAVATQLATTLDAAHQALGDLAETTETTPGGSVFNRR